VPLGERRRGASDHRSPARARRAGLRREHPQAARRRGDGRGRGRGAGPDVRRRRAHRRRDTPLLDLVAPAEARPWLQPCGTHRRDDGAPRARRSGERRDGPRGPRRPDLSAEIAVIRWGGMPTVRSSST
jgi:hypothetical protein